MDGAQAAPRAGSAWLAAASALASDLADLKRIRDARSTDSLATRAFRAAWTSLCAGQDIGVVADQVTADALAATRLGAIDRAVLQQSGATDPRAILQRGYDSASTSLPGATRARLRNHVAQSASDSWPARAVAGLPPSVEALGCQPRAGATCPGKPRIILEPAESHADHCLSVAVIGVTVTELYGADPAVVFLAGLVHHLHNAVLPDSGFAGEIMLGDELAPVMQNLFAREIATLPAHLAAPVRHALDVIVDAETPEGRAFHAADVIDRVLQMQYYERVASFRARHALEDLNLVHEGPVQSFHHDVLAEAGLW